MINFRVNIVNPICDRFDSIKCWAGKTFVKNKFWEIQVMKDNVIIALDLRITTRQSHAGAELWLGLLGYSINFQIYDNRHWNHEEGRWVSLTNDQRTAAT